MDKMVHTVTKEMVDSLALYIYAKGYGKDDNPDEVYNSWLTSSGVKLEKLSDAVMMLEKACMFMNMDRCDLLQSLQIGNLI